MNPKVSVVVPVYRAEAYLTRCVESLRNQTLRDIEIILVDDGSPDGCPALCDKLAEEDSRIRVIHKRNEGAGPSRNAGIRVAAGDYIGFVDSDDFVLPDMYEKMWTAAARMDADFVLTGEINFARSKEGEEKHCFSSIEVFEGTEGRKKLLQGIAGAFPWEPEDSRYGFAIWNKLYRRTTILDHGVMFASERDVMSEDMLFLLDFVPMIQRAVGIPGAFYYYRDNQTSISKGYQPGKFALLKTLVTEMDKRLARALPTEDYQMFLDRQFQAQARALLAKEILHSDLSGTGRRELTGVLKKSCGDKALSECLKRFPWRRLPAKQAVFAFAMRYRLYWLMIGLTRLRYR